MLPPLAEIDWNMLLADPGLLILVAVWTIIGVVVLGTVIAIQWRKAQQARREAELKHEMIERGFTAQEIVSVINAGVAAGKPRKTPRRAGQVPARVDTPGVPQAD